MLLTNGAEDTRRVAATLADALRPGDIVSLTGELGAGKTCFVQGAAAALGVTDRVTSPSFLLRRDYRGNMPVIHLDVYRLETLQEVMDLGYDEAIPAAGGADGHGEQPAAVTFVEWGDAMSPLLPPDYLEVELRHLEPAADADLDAVLTRLVTLRAHGDDWRRRLASLAAPLAAWAAPAEVSNDLPERH